MPKPAIIFQPDVQNAFQRGINQIVDAVTPTLGPLSRNVSIERNFPGQAPEILDNGGVIARRIIELPDRSDNAGAMWVRHLLWRLHENTGDGTATAAIIFQTVYNEGLRYLAAGGNAMQLRRELEQGLDVILDMLDEMTLPVKTRTDIARLAEATAQVPEMAASLGEILDVIGPFGQLDIRTGRARGYEHHYVDGTYWKSGVFSDQMIRDKLLDRRTLTHAAILISDLEIQDPHDLVPLMRLAVRDDVNGLVIIAKKISDQIKALIINNEKPGRFDIIAVKPLGSKAADQASNLQDLAFLVGGRPLIQAAGDSLHTVQWEDLGHARRAWADSEYFGVVGGQGDVPMLRQQIERLQRIYHTSTDLDERKDIQRRVGRLLGGSAVLRVAGITKAESTMRKDLAERTAAGLRGALLEGALPGGGTALLACQQKLQGKHGNTPEAIAANRILCRALRAPAQAILENAGYDPGEILAQINGSGEGFDVVRGKIVNMKEAGILDSAMVIKAAVRTAITSAALALTTDVLIQQRQPPQSTAP